MSSGYVFKNIHNISQRNDSITFKNIDGNFDKGDVSSGYGSMNKHTDLQRNGVE